MNLNQGNILPKRELQSSNYHSLRCYSLREFLRIFHYYENTWALKNLGMVILLKITGDYQKFNRFEFNRNYTVTSFADMICPKL